MLRSVLVIEDNEAHRRIIRDALDGSGVNEIASAHSIDAALRFLRDRIDRGGRLPSLILADLYMGSAAGASRITDGDGSPPPPPGLRLLRELQAPRLDRVPVVMLSACEDQALIDACIEAGARAFVQKTPEYDRFREAIYDTVKFWAATCDASDTPAAAADDACPPDRCEPNTDGRRRAQHNNGKDNGKHNGQLDGHHEGHADGDASDLRRSASA
jgi:CheY-like chemotaxis protein